MDTISKEHRSWNMSRIRSKNTIPERHVRSWLHKAGFRFRLHVKNLPGKPDIVLKKYQLIIQVRGCFWHQHPSCKRATMPTTRIEYWAPKLTGNVQRDHECDSALIRSGWHVLVLWECEIKDESFKKRLIEIFPYLQKK